ncbi:MAG TPA: hypothetical protein VIJ27_08980, partial [Mucilaginibacter sp.]
LPVIAADSNTVIGVLSYRDILSAYKGQMDENLDTHIHISLKRQRLKMLIRGRKLININEGQKGG